MEGFQRELFVPRVKHLFIFLRLRKIKDSRVLFLSSLQTCPENKIKQNKINQDNVNIRGKRLKISQGIIITIVVPG